MQPTPIAIAVVEHAGEFLVGRRPPGVPLAGYWEFPGGKVLPGETPEAAAVRECLEETGLSVEACGVFPEVVHRYDHARLRLYFIAARSICGLAPPREPFLWVPRAHLAQLTFPPANAALIAHCLAPPQA